MDILFITKVEILVLLNLVRDFNITHFLGIK